MKEFPYESAPECKSKIDAPPSEPPNAKPFWLSLKIQTYVTIHSNKFYYISSKHITLILKI